MNKPIKNLIILVTVLVLITNTNFSYANNCKIKETPEYLKEYIETIRVVVTNTNNAVSKKIQDENIDIYSDEKSYIGRIYWAYNSIFNWNSYEIGYEYIIQEDQLEIPREVERDVNILENEFKKIRLANNRAAWVALDYESICLWIDESICKFNKVGTTNAIQVIAKIKNSISQLQKLIENQATDINLKDRRWIILFSDTNLERLFNDYSKESIKNCNLSDSSNWEKWFFLTIIQEFQKISFLSKKTDNTQNEWKEAIEILFWSYDEMQYKQLERQLLSKELQKQWIWWDWASVIISNLDAYNKNWVLLEWEYWFLNSLREQIESFEETIKIDFPEYTTDIVKSSSEFAKKVVKIKNQEKHLITINSEYRSLKNIWIDDDISDNILIDRMIKMHLHISDMINTLNKTCPIAVKVCNSQKIWQWDCWQCF